MGKGDIKTKKGKIRAGSFGNSRPQRFKKVNAAVEMSKEGDSAKKKTSKKA